MNWMEASAQTVRVYLDNCSLQRPLDDASHLRIALEAEAVLGILTLVQQGIVELVHSDALAFEISQTPHPQRQVFAADIVAEAAISIPFSPAVITWAKALETAGIKPLDALHVASAEQAGAHYFCTCDDRLRKRLHTLTDLAVTVRAPLELVQELLP
jgi:predicted nucleic acid-binding protein